ncbi:hypothetical protein CLV71_103291 [Actinophytocola oryzae]|uniref:Uncharacterized protein n=1 Tax=Actinophytocola oryzae TaxID=502181 RepID=A0A4R7VY16_9PSEU|nr:hypothetical protein CLV71_103291 [Actinophytocola oryzae]
MPEIANLVDYYLAKNEYEQNSAQPRRPLDTNASLAPSVDFAFSRIPVESRDSRESKEESKEENQADDGTPWEHLTRKDVADGVPVLILNTDGTSSGKRGTISGGEVRKLTRTERLPGGVDKKVEYDAVFVTTGQEADTKETETRKRRKGQQYPLVRLRLPGSSDSDPESKQEIEAEVSYSAEVRALLELWKTKGIGDRMGTPSAETLRMAKEAADEFSRPPRTEDRTVYLKDGTFADAERLFRKLTGPVTVTGTAATANRTAMKQIGGGASAGDSTWYLREESKNMHEIAATIELQLSGSAGKHSCEYKFVRSREETSAALARIEGWQADPEKARTIRRRFEVGQDPRDTDVTADLVGGSYGRVRRAYFASMDEVVSRKVDTYFKPEAWQKFGTYPVRQRLLFLNRNFTGSRVDMERRQGDSLITSRKDHDLADGLARIDNVLAYQKKSPSQQEPARAHRDVPPARMGGEPVPVASVGRLFWDRFRAMDATRQIAVIEGSIDRAGREKSDLEIAEGLAYLRAQQPGKAEPVSRLRIAEVEFVINSAHSYKFHEHSMDSHPGLGGTQQEVELAIMRQALERYRADALPRPGLVGSISESKHAVVVNGVRIVYLAWSPAPGSGLIHIPDYMAKTEG